MTDVLMNKFHLVGRGYAEMPQDGRRYRFLIERYRHDDGTEWGQIVSMEEIPDVGPYLWVPSWGADSPEEADHLHEEQTYEQEHPHPLDEEWWAQHRDVQTKRKVLYDELRDKRAQTIKQNHRTMGG